MTIGGERPATPSGARISLSPSRESQLWADELEQLNFPYGSRGAVPGRFRGVEQGIPLETWVAQEQPPGESRDGRVSLFLARAESRHERFVRSPLHAPWPALIVP